MADRVAGAFVFRLMTGVGLGMIVADVRRQELREAGIEPRA